MTALRVARYDGIDQLRSWAAVVDRLNAESADWSPFHSSAFLIAYATHSEFFPGGIEPCTYIAFGGPGGDEAVGLLVVRRQRVRIAPKIGYTRVDFLATHDNDHCTIVTRSGCEVSAAEAILDRLLAEKDWALVEFRGQEDGSVLRTLARRRAGVGLRVREIDLVPFERVPLVWSDLAGYFAALSKRMRSNVSRQTRHLYAAGQVQLVFAEGEAAVGPLFDAFCDLENRSWKAGTEAAVQRHPARKAFYAEITAGRAGLEPSFVGVVLDGVLIAGLINASGGGHTWSLEMAFDCRHADIGPGQLLLLLTVGEAIRKGSASLRFFQHHEYFKKRWLSEPTPAVNIQLIRTRSVMGAQALIGDLRRKWRTRHPNRSAAAAGTDAAGGETSGGETSGAEPSAASSPVLSDAAGGPTLALDQVFRAAGEGLRLLDASAAAELLPFPITVKR